MGGRRGRVSALGVSALLVALLVPTDPTRAGPLDGTPLCGVATPTGDVAPVADDGTLRVATFNVLHSETEDGDVSLGERLPLLADSIVRSGADVVGAQEVTRNVAFDAAAEAPQKHGLVAQRLAAAVADRTGQPWHWCWSLSNPHVPLSPDVDPGGGNPLDTQAAARGNFPEGGDFSEGLAILTRFDIEATRFRRLPPRSYEAVGCVSLDPFCPPAALFDSRQVLWARVATPGGGFDMFTTHVAHTLTPLSDATRLVQTQQALAITAEWATPDALPDFLVGDFNSAPDSPVLTAAIDAGFVDTYGTAGGPECGETGAPPCSGGPPDGNEVFSDGPARTMSERIDYVLARPPTGCTLAVPASAAIGDAPSELDDGRWLWPSDHLGFVSTVSCASSAAEGSGDVAADVRSTLPATGGDARPAWAGAAALVAVTVAAARRRARYI